ncbi:uncharacterized protein [Euwallacea similis]|uniref:uncharacterized protein n=1 Tax=Euwallacea similis TaxID=1736056 RepID=UPI00344E7569
MMLLCYRVLVSLLFSPALEVFATQCDLAKTFRTPKDLSKINFDHLEIVERNNFQSSEVATSTEPSVISKEPKLNSANAQVLIHFGGSQDDGSSHIMKIPPQCRNQHYDNNPQMDYFPPRFSGPPHYYHPYPQPVPFAFPNFYFWNDTPNGRYLPFQLREYFDRQPKCIQDFPGQRDQVFIGGRPLTKEDLVNPHARAASARNLRGSQIKGEVVKVNATRRAKAEESLKEEEKVRKRKEELRASHRNILESAKHQKKYHKKKHQIKDIKNTTDCAEFELIENILKKALRALTCDNSTAAVSTQERSNKCHDNNKINSSTSHDKKFLKDMDDLITLIVEVSPEQPMTDPTSIPAPKLSNTNLDLGSSRGTNQIPNSSVLNFDFPQEKVLTQSLSKTNNWVVSPYHGTLAHYFIPEPNVVMSNPLVEAAPLVKLMKVVSKLEVLPGGAEGFIPIMEEGIQCAKCGRRNGGGNFCINCGFPIQRILVN